MWNTVLGRILGGVLMLAAASTAPAQESTNLGDYLGPGVASRGAGDIGTRSGEQVSLRYYAGVSGIVDTNLQPFALDAQGNLIRIHNLYGVQVNGGIYGVHHWKRAQLGLDYAGNYHRYVNANSFQGSDQHLNLGYSLQMSRRWMLQLQESAGTISTATSSLILIAPSDSNSAFTPASFLFDARTTFLQSSAFATYSESARTSFTFGGSGFLQDQKAVGLSNSGQYTFTGSVQRRMSKTTTLGASYSYSHFEFPAYHSTSDSNRYHGTFARALGQFWTFSLEAGVTISEVNSRIVFALSPELAALFGQSTITNNSYTRSLFPSGSVSLQRKFNRAKIGFDYSREASSGNGASGTGRLDSAGVSLSYTGLRKVNMGLNGGYYNLASIGQNTGKYATYSASAGFTYALGHGISLAARYGGNQQQVSLINFKRTSTSATLGLMFSPGTLPLALW
ncbi:MAG: hypothetical protein M3N41_06210 [Acidobacteriota bacterium]|nr:hypothetical protein [Acidobacteriota bacterium]